MYLCHQYAIVARLFSGLCYLGLPTWITPVWGMEISVLSWVVWIPSKGMCLQVMQRWVNILCNQRDATYTMFFIIISALYVSGGFSAHHQEPIKLYVQPWVLSCLLAEFQPIHTSGRQQESMTYSFIGSWWWAEKPPETCTALMIIRNTV
jgi:hypothetical protein